MNHRQGLKSTFYQYFRKNRTCDSRSIRFINRLPKNLGASLTIHTYNNNNRYDENYGWDLPRGFDQSSSTLLSMCHCPLDSPKTCCGLPLRGREQDSTCSLARKRRYANARFPSATPPTSISWCMCQWPKGQSPMGSG